jgi:hypothetical protein
MPRSRQLVIIALLTAVVALPASVPAGALAQSAGDEQYVDPFQNEGGGGNSGGGGGSGEGDEGTAGGDTGTTGGDTGSGSTGTAGTDTGSATSPSTTTESATGTAADGPALPATGLPVGVAFGGGLLLLSSGFMLRRRA